jgi:carbamoyltransferase
MTIFCNSVNQQSDELILGIWDGHDAGAALISGSRILFAVNEERLSRRKLEIGFPQKSIECLLKSCQLDPSAIAQTVCSTWDFGKTLARVMPSLREDYYLIRRRKKHPGQFVKLKKLSKYWITEFPPSRPTHWLSTHQLAQELKLAGFACPKPRLVGHHQAHAAGAAFCSRFSQSLVTTIDGIGDGLSGSFWSLVNGKLELLSKISGRTSLGIFFEHVTNLLHMRELEDEGKVMALANFACPVADKDNPLLSFFSVEGLALRAKYSSLRMYQELSKVLWSFPPEQFAYLAQRTLELKVVELVKNALQQTGHRNLAYAGGVASNVKVNMLLSELAEVDQLFVFPHMGDGGLALGAALWDNYTRNKTAHYEFNDVFLGPACSEVEILSALKHYPGLSWKRCPEAAQTAADLLAQGKIVLWFEGRMEFGPRALGARSILSRADSLEVKDELNLRLKNRVWYQPFCPVMLDEDAHRVLENYNGLPNLFMTCAYRTKKEARQEICGVINIDGTCRPQIVPKEMQTRYAELIRYYKQKTGSGILLNTSFNLHGEPLVCSPLDALNTFSRTDIHHLFIEDYWITKGTQHG